jgi:hypothetical protein
MKKKKNSTLLEQYQNMVFSVFHSMDLGTVPTVWYFFSFSFYGFWNCSNSVVFSVFHSMDLGTVPTVWYSFSFSFYGFWNCSNSVLFFFFFILWILKEKKYHTVGTVPRSIE